MDEELRQDLIQSAELARQEYRNALKQGLIHKPEPDAAPENLSEELEAEQRAENEGFDFQNLDASDDFKKD